MKNSKKTSKYLFYLLIVLSFLIVSGCNNKQQKNNTLTENEKKAGWILLFDGKTLNGWRGFGLDKAPEGWVAEDGTIKILPKTDCPGTI